MGFFSSCFVQWLYHQLTTGTWLHATPHTCEKVLMFPLSIYQSSLRILFYWLIDVFWIVDHGSSGCSWIHHPLSQPLGEDCRHVLACCQLCRKPNLGGVKNVASCSQQQCVPGCTSAHCFLPKKLHVTEIEHPTFIWCLQNLQKESWSLIESCLERIHIFSKFHQEIGSKGTVLLFPVGPCWLPREKVPETKEESQKRF